MPVESLFLVSDIPADVALVIGTACGTTLVSAIAVLYRRQIVLEDRAQVNVERVAASSYATADAINKLTEAIKEATRHAERAS